MIEVDPSFLDKKVVLVTGGTGSFGSAFVSYLLEHTQTKAIRIFSRDELKQYEMQRNFKDARLRFFLGDVRDRDRLKRACEGVDYIIHAAALKQVMACEYNPFEAIQTNIMGAVNVVDAAIDCGVKKVLALSTDKAVNPANLYGATKLCSDKVFIHGNSYTGSRGTRFACVRYGNVFGSRGSVFPLFREQAQKGKIELTDFRMTRFWIRLDQAVRFVTFSLSEMVGGELFVPKIPSMKVVDLAQVIAPNAKRVEIGIRPGEKIHETLITVEEARHTIDLGQYFIIKPEWFHREIQRPYQGKTLPEDFSYTSNENSDWISEAEMSRWIEPNPPAPG
ncbi:MAG: UDP-N-acetylglucosamine 4,6-dehydratase (inverting) [Acidobacteria bacterium]|nr:UDP-N-acetylglucosamine 4,6-dehydratase (inverting) [Acidobacteriota bacterium]MCB9396293.1 UDP-N-acetylglucosamine 4,6-dehydratase (inverting) [Acidobacteriota bacterium]